MKTAPPVYRRILSASAFIGLIMAMPVQAADEAPLSVIDWLGTQAPPAPVISTAIPNPDEPAVAATALAPAVTVQPLQQGGPREIGLVPASMTGLPATLWSGSDPDTLIALIAKMPDLRLPAAQSLLYTVLLADARAPGNDVAAGDRLALARVEKLMQRGALDPALSLIEQAGVKTSAAHFDLWMRLSLLTGIEDRACEVLMDAPHLSRDYGVLTFCTLRAGDWENAALTLGSAKALGLLPDETLALLERFMDPEPSEQSAPTPQPRDMDPLTFRLFEAIGEPIPTGNLPRAYAVADLRDLAGWKAQLEAAERLTRAGALPDNRLLGLYTERKAAASGGIWDRVTALQQFDTALASGSAEAVAKTLPAVWRMMASAELEVSFAALYASSLATVSLDGRAEAIARKARLLSNSYEAVATQMGTSDLATQIALGQPGPGRPADVMQAAVYDGFAQALPRADLVDMVKQDRLGESILQTLKLLHEGANGNARALTEALATLRALGLEDTARRAALQILLLER